MNYTLITGASNGIGYELALQFAKHGHNIILVARDEEKLKKVSDDLEKVFKVKTLIIPADLSHPHAADEIYRNVLENKISVNYLVNNAGFYVKGSFSETSWEEEQNLIRLQCLTYTRMIKLFLPVMISIGEGGILNMGSTGSFVPGPYNAVYCAAKSFVLSLSEAVAQEVSGSGVTVTALCPGGIRTDFWKGTSRKKSFLFPMMEASEVARAGYRGLMKGKRVVIPGKIDRINVFLTRFYTGKNFNGNSRKDDTKSLINKVSMYNLKEWVKPEFFKTIFFGTKYLANYWFLGKTSPLICGLVLHNKCNLRCRHCRVVDRQTAPMSYEEATGVIDTFYANGGRCLYLEGGEPFLWKYGAYSMEDIVSYARHKGYYTVIIYTNGTMPLESAASTIFVSVDGLKDTHDELRGKTFEKIFEHISKSNHPSIYINYTINSVNKNDIEGFCRHIDSIPQIRGVFFYFHTPYYGYDEHYLDTRQKNKVLEKLISLKSGHKILNSETGLRSAIRNDWKKNLGICSVYEEGTYYRCCRESNNSALCEHCGYLSYAEIEQTLKLNPGAMINALKYF